MEAKVRIGTSSDSGPGGNTLKAPESQRGGRSTAPPRGLQVAKSEGEESDSGQWGAYYPGDTLTSRVIRKLAKVLPYLLGGKRSFFMAVNFLGFMLLV